MSRYWMIVAAKNHVMRGKEAGIVQANHGKAAPLRRMQVGDGIVFYSSKLTLEGGEKLQAFTVLAKVTGEEVYPFDMGDGFVPYRRNAEFLACAEFPIQPLIPELSFIHNKTHWGFIFRFGFLEIPQKDYELIARHMQAEP